MKAKGETMLKVVGILLIVFSAIGIVIYLLALIGASAASAAYGILAGRFMAVITIGAIFGLIGCALNMVAGILGVKNCAVPAKAQSCFILGVIMIAVQVLVMILNISSGSFNFLTTLIGLVLPVLYLVGAVQNKSMLTAPQQQQPPYPPYPPVQ